MSTKWGEDQNYIIKMKDNNKIPFNKPVVIDKASNYINEVVRSGRLSGGHEFNKKCSRWLEKQTKSIKAFLTTSCTHSL
ncbi:hypothetical protein ACFL0O_12325, partial [Thermodesulfobacteriota bacterium]